MSVSSWERRLWVRTISLPNGATSSRVGLTAQRLNWTSGRTNAAVAVEVTNRIKTPMKRQERLVRFLESPSSYPHRPAEVCRIETHISWVFIASPFVFKAKKPVDLGFLDFTTMEQRHYFCRRELELNRRLCPEIYLSVMPIYESEGRFSFDDENGEIADYALKMREMSRGSFLRELLAKNAVGEPQINRVISRLHQFYESERPRP